MTDKSIEVLKLMGNKVNVRIITLLRRHPTGQRDLSRYLNKKEGDVVRRLKAMEKHGLVKGSWGSRLGQNVKLYSLVTHDISVTLKQEGLQIAFGKDKKAGKNLESAVMSLHSNVYDEQEQQPREEFDMVGRASELKLVHESEKANFFFIIGIAGIGKTSFAKKYIQGSTITKEKVFWHTFKEIDTFPYVMSRLALFLSKNGADDLVSQLDLSSGTRIEDSESHNLEILIESLNRVKGCVLVFDDYHKVRDEKISVLLKHIQGKLFPANKSLVLSRSKAPFFLDNVHGRELVLGGLTLADSEKMISHLGANVDESALLDIWKRFAGH